LKNVSFSKKNANCLGKRYQIGRFGPYPSAYLHIDEQGVIEPDSMPLVTEVARDVNPAAIVLVGIAFGASPDEQKIGDVLISKDIISYDLQKYRGGKPEYKGKPQRAGFQLVNAFSDPYDWNHPLPSGDISKVWPGTLLTGSKLIDDYNLRTELLNHFAEFSPIGGDMEAQGAYVTTKIIGIPEWIIIKGICDWAFDKNNINKEFHQKVAADAAVEYCYKVFSRPGVFDSISR